MTILATVSNAMGGWPPIRKAQDGVVVPTHCLYPSNGIVYVYVVGGDNTFTVHDGGDALDEL